MSCCAGQSVTSHALDLADTALGHDIEEARIRHASHAGSDGSIQTDFLVPGMHCVNCIKTLENGLKRIDGVKQARANLSTRRVSIIWDATKTSGTSIFGCFGALGYEARLYDLEQSANEGEREGQELLIATGVAGFAAANIMLLSVSVWSGTDAETTQLFHLISGLIAIPTVFYSGRHFFRSAANALKLGRLNMDVPISLAVLLALSMSIVESIVGGAHAYFDASVTLLFFLLIGRYLDHQMRERARGAVNRLARLAAKGAAVIGEGGELRFTPLGEVGIGARIMVLAGERVPLDAAIDKGRSEVDRSLVTGESEPVMAEPGMELEAGSLNLAAPLEMIVLRSAEHSFIGEVMQMMEAAEQGKAHYVRLADRLAAIYSPAVHILAFSSFALWMLYTGGDWKTSIYVSIAVLIVTCPCALGLAVPIVHVVGAGRMFEGGIMIKDGAAFEKLAETDYYVFDKTGTLTRGEPSLVARIGNHSLNEIAGQIARLSSHPAGRAIAASTTCAADKLSFENVQEIAGYGLEARIETPQGAKTVRFGRPEWVREIAPVWSAEENADRLSVACGVEGEAMLGFKLDDRLRDGARETIEALKQQGLGIEILSGDRGETVSRIAGQLGVENFSHDMRPQDKVRRLAQLQASGKKVCMVGDGINDAPALAAAHTSIAPSSGSDIGRLAADLIFTHPGLQSVLFARSMAQATNRLVRQNFAIAIVYNMFAVPLAFLGFVTPLFAAIAMSTSSILVIGNSLRLKLIGRKRFQSLSATLTSREFNPQLSSKSSMEPAE